MLTVSRCRRRRSRSNGNASTAARRRSAASERIVRLGSRHHDNEFLAAVAGKRIERAGVGAQRIGDGTKRRVAGGVAVLVVDQLEMIDIDHQHGDLAGLRRCPTGSRRWRIR